MTQNRISLIMVGVICVFLLSCSDKKTKENDRWVIFGFTENGSLYYDKMSVTNESQKIIKVWSKLKYSKVGKVMSFNAAMPPVLGDDILMSCVA